MRRAALERVAFFCHSSAVLNRLGLAWRASDEDWPGFAPAIGLGRVLTAFNSPWSGPLTSGVHSKAMHTSQTMAPVLQAFFGLTLKLLASESPKSAEQDNPIRAKGTRTKRHKSTVNTSASSALSINPASTTLSRRLVACERLREQISKAWSAWQATEDAAIFTLRPHIHE